MTCLLCLLSLVVKKIKMRITVHNVSARPDKPKWPIEESVGVDVSCTPSLPFVPPNPPYVGTDLANPFEENEHVGVDEEDMYSEDSDNEGGASEKSSNEDISEDEEDEIKDANFVPDDREKSSDEDISEDEVKRGSQMPNL
jgi:hypothetical protein